MKLCAQGASRQEAHEQIRILSNEAGSVVKNEVSCPAWMASCPSLLFASAVDRVTEYLRGNRMTWYRGSRATTSSSRSGMTLTACSEQSCISVVVWTLSTSIVAQGVLLRRHWLLTRSTLRAQALRSLTSSYVITNLAEWQQLPSPQVETKEMAQYCLFFESRDVFKNLKSYMILSLDQDFD